MYSLFQHALAGSSTATVVDDRQETTSNIALSELAAVRQIRESGKCATYGSRKLVGSGSGSGREFYCLIHELTDGRVTFLVYEGL